ncbi:hypothetical protein [Morganella sp. GD04133]|uniref:hypothetical protein n=1 Tax=Morganella sp. GD04133 TaxID=2975435 RepID=UPI00244C4042|nr:hypothetical protein [Morganella sp. GD04133]MDH0356592.1 MoaD/ThiS family protein [Morganella sp. GD04133]
MNNSDEISGQYCSFKSPLNEGEFFAIQAGFVMPEGVKPVIDGSAGLCIGYLYGMGDIYHVYDINGYSQGLCTLAPESALSEPLDLLLVSGIVAEPDGRISLLMRYGTIRSVSSGSTLRDMPVIQALKSKIIQHNTKRIRYSPLAIRAMAERHRYVPAYILDRAVKKGRRVKLTPAVCGGDLLTCLLKIRKYSHNGQYQDITLSVIVDGDRKIIKEFNY